MSYAFFVNNYLIPLTNPDNPERAALSDLRRGLGDFPGISPWMHRHVRPHMPEKTGQWETLTWYLTAALFAAHQLPATQGNLGDHFNALLDRQSPEANKPVERRFTALLAAHPADLHFHLRQAIIYLKTREIPVNWLQLMWDISAWNNPDRRARVQEQWAARFWQRARETDNVETESSN